MCTDCNKLVEFCENEHGQLVCADCGEVLFSRIRVKNVRIRCLTCKTDVPFEELIIDNGWYVHPECGNKVCELG